MRKTTFLKLKLREASFLSRGLLSTRHVVLAHLIPMRRCNLACGYCNEYDHSSSPVPLETIKRRIDKLASLGTSIITISGGEPMMHPGLDDIIGHIRTLAPGRSRHWTSYLHQGLGVGGHRVGPQTNGTARFSLIKIPATSRPLALRVPQRLP